MGHIQALIAPIPIGMIVFLTLFTAAYHFIIRTMIVPLFRWSRCCFQIGSAIHIHAVNFDNHYC